MAIEVIDHVHLAMPPAARRPPAGSMPVHLCVERDFRPARKALPLCSSVSFQRSSEGSPSNDGIHCHPWTQAMTSSGTQVSQAMNLRG
jgi:hypothetical protein